MTAMNDALDHAADILKAAKRLLIGTGAGMSADSGVQTYRAAGERVWRNYGVLERLGRKAEDLACPQALGCAACRCFAGYVSGHVADEHAALDAD